MSIANGSGAVATFALSVEARARLTAAVEALAPALGMGRVRAIVRDVFDRNLSESEVKKRVPNAAAAARELAGALSTQAARSRTLAVLAKLTIEAWGSPNLDDRVRTAFERAHSALETLDLPRYEREVQVLDGLATTMPSELLDHRLVLLALASRNGERVVHALEGQPPHVAASGPPTGMLAPVAATPSAPDTTAPGSLAEPAPAPGPAAEQAPGSARPPPGISPAQEAQVAAGPGALGLIAVLATLRGEVEAAALAADVPPPSAADAAVLWRSSVDLARLSLDTTSDAAGASLALRALSDAALAAAHAVDGLISQRTSERAGATAKATALLGSASVAELLAAVDELTAQLGQLPASVPDKAGHAALAAAGPISKRLAGLKEWATTAQVDAEKRRRIEDLERELAALRGDPPIVIAPPVSPSPPPTPPPPTPRPVERVIVAPVDDDTGPVPTLAFANASGFPMTFPRGAFLSTLKTGNSRAAKAFLPFDPNAGVVPTQQAPAVDRLNGAAGWIVRVCREDVMQGNAPLSNYLTILDDVATLLSNSLDVEASRAFLMAVTGLLLLPASELGPRARDRLATALVRSGDPRAVLSSFHDALGSADRSGLVQVLAKLLSLKLNAEVVFLTVTIQRDRPAASRGWADALGVAMETLPPTERERFLQLALKAAELAAEERASIERWLDSVGPKKAARPLDVDHPVWLVDALGRFAECEYETGERGEASVNASVPLRVRETGLHIPAGSERAVLPVLVRNAGLRGAAAVEVRLSTGAESGCSLPADGRHAYVRWIGREGLEPPHDAIFEVPVDLSPDQALKEIRVSAYVRWAGPHRATTKDLVYTVVSTPLIPARANLPVEGVKGSPLDLNDSKVLARSSKTVKDCLTGLAASLREGQTVRALVYGRRRRGKSSIRRTIASDPAIKRHFLVAENTWNSAPMSTVGFALDHLAGLVRRALLDRGEEARPFQPRDGASRDEVAACWQEWIEGVNRGLKAPARVLLLLDEFQKWLSGLPDKLDRLTLLNAFRAFNDTPGSRLDVAFILFGLQNLLRFQKESIDFAAAVKSWQIKPLTLEESKRYVQECLPQAHDDRVRRRLHVLCGGNPFVLNVFCQQLADRANELNRGYCIPSDVESLLERFVDDRVEAVFAYMMREDEEENAPSLTQLTVLRAVASRLHETGGHDGWVRVEDVEAWLRAKSVAFDPGLPSEHILQLVDLGVLERHIDGRRVGLQGEAICRWLASQDDARVPLQPVTSRRDLNLVLNRYRQIRSIADGGQATTWLAENVEEGGHKVVLKIYRDQGGDVRGRVDREGEMLKRVKSPYVITCLSHSVDERKGGVLVLEWVDGPTLAEVLRDRPAAASGILPGGQVGRQVELFKKIAAGVAAVHAARVVHKDLKPQNILVVEASGVFEPKIIDFGIAGDEPGAGGGTTQSAGTWRYLAPEKRQDPSVPRARPADIYSLGMVFLDVLVGAAQADDASRMLAQLPQTLPGKLGRLLREMVANDPSERPTADLVRSRLEGVLEPGGWAEFADLAASAYLEERYEEAVTLYERALGEARVADRSSPKFSQVVGDLLALLNEKPCAVKAWDALVDAGLDALALGKPASSLSEQMFACIRAGVGVSTGWSRWDSLLDGLERRTAPNHAWVPLLRFIMGDPTVVRHHGDRLFELVSRFREADVIDSAAVANCCAVAAGAARKVADQTGVIETWLRRGRRVHPALTLELSAEMKAFDQLQERTQARASLPPNCDHQDTVVVGSAEKGHINMDRMERFAARLLLMHPYVCAVKRKRKDGDLAASAPRLLEDSNLAQHRVDGLDDNCLIPFVLDGSFTSEDVTIRMNIVLPKGTTASQRKVARDAIAANGQLFP